MRGWHLRVVPVVEARSARSGGLSERGGALRMRIFPDRGRDPYAGDMTVQITDTQWIAGLDRDGAGMVEGVFDEATVAALRTEAERLLAGAAPQASAAW